MQPYAGILFAKENLKLYFCLNV